MLYVDELLMRCPNVFLMEILGNCKTQFRFQNLHNFKKLMKVSKQKNFVAAASSYLFIIRKLDFHVRGLDEEKLLLKAFSERR